MKCVCKRKARAEKGCCVCGMFKLLWRVVKFFAKLVGKLAAILAPIYAVLFTVFYFDLDGKLLYYVVEPFLCKHYDKMERKNPLEQPYEMTK